MARVRTHEHHRPVGAYVKPTVASYLEDLLSGLREAGVEAPPYAMRSSGGVSSFGRAVERRSRCSSPARSPG